MAHAIRFDIIAQVGDSAAFNKKSLDFVLAALDTTNIQNVGGGAGDLTTGETDVDFTPSTALAANSRIVVVTSNYEITIRLGGVSPAVGVTIAPLGADLAVFFATVSGCTSILISNASGSTAHVEVFMGSGGG